MSGKHMTQWERAEAMRLRRVEGLSIEQIARRIGRSRSGVGSLLRDVEPPPRYATCWCGERFEVNRHGGRPHRYCCKKHYIKAFALRQQGYDVWKRCA